jgi:signal transduction histidine kinase/CheY-like chemotaxis protein
MSNDLNKQTHRWLLYAVALISGITLGLTLVFIAWNSAIEENKREFSFESSKVREPVAHNVKVSNDIINSLATFIDVSNAIDVSNVIDDQIFQSNAKGILDQQLFIEGILFSNLDKTGNNTFSNFILEAMNSRFRDVRPSIGIHDIRNNDNFDNILKSLLMQDEIEPVVSVINLESKKYYALFKAIRSEDNTEIGVRNVEDSIKGILCLLISPEKLIEYSEIPNTLTVDLYSESSNLIGRNLIFNSVASLDNRDGFLVSSFNRDASIQLPSYSVKLSITKDIFWQDINQELIYIALLIGMGITLLLMALVRAKDLREKELSERNIVIELKVEEQTTELALARDKALDASRMKSDFLASMSHEIRTPLTAIIGMAELLSDTKLSNDQDKYVKVFRKAGDTLLSLVNDILDLSKIEAEQLVLEDIPFDLLDVIEESVEIYAIKAAERNVELTSIIEPKLDMNRTGDPARLRQIILNLISNAIKFTEGGHITVNVSDSNSGEIQISVSDTGVGIPQEKQQAIFASFTQADSSTTRKYGGTGLGLTISKRLVEMMNGRIWVESEEGKGSTFSITVNLPNNKSATRNDLLLDEFLKDKRVFVLDHNHNNRSKICNILNTYGAESIESEELLPGSESSVSSDDTTKYQYIFLDYKTLLECSDEEIIELRRSYPGIVIIAMLGPVSLHQKINLVNELGLDGYLTKPIKQSELLHVFTNKDEQEEESHLGKEQIDPVTDETTLEKKRILLVEDNEDNRLLVKTYLKKYPYIIEEAENGQIAVDLYRENTYNLILMDVQMPIMDGHEATRAMRVLEAESGRPLTPIIALTAHAIKEEIDKCMAAGCDTHVGKPIKKSTLISIIEDFVT